MACSPVASAGARDLSTFGYGNARTGATADPALPVSSVPRLHRRWRVRLNGAINAQPLVLHAIRAAGHRRTLVLVATEHGVVAALDGASGRAVWRHRVGTRILRDRCQAGPDGRFGVTGTMVADRRSGRVYAVDATGRAWALRLADGHALPGWPVRVHPRGDDFVWSALTLAAGRLYVPISSLCDAGHYQGGVTSIDTATRGVARWETTGGTGAYAGGIWGWGGASADAHANLYVATGNSLGTFDEGAGYSEQVVRLDPGLRVVAHHAPLAPPFAAADRDFGSAPTLLDASGCPPLLVALNKTGQLFLYDRDTLGDGPLQTIRVAGASGVPLYGDVAYDARSRTLILQSPSDPPGSSLREGMQAFGLGRDCRLAARWNTPIYSGPGSAPMIAGRAVYLATGGADGVAAYALGNGRRLWSARLSGAAAVAAPAIDGARVYVADWAGVVRAFGPPRR